MTALIIIVTATVTLLVSILLRNLSSGEAKIEHRIGHCFGVSSEQFQRAVGHLLGPPIVGGNEVTALHNGEQIFPAMLAAIRQAETSITFETYIYWSGEIAREFSEAIAERARAGVKVHVLLDWAGSFKMDDELLDTMQEAGVEIERYHPLRWYSLDRINNRTHRKLLVVDGRIGFTGGVGIADEWQGRGDSPDHWRDSHYRVEGPAVAHMQTAFMDNWLKTHATVLFDERYFPRIEEAGAVSAQMFKSSPREGSESARLLYLLTMASAERSLRIGNPYFVPDDLALETLIEAARRGVKVEIVTVGPVTDAQVTRRASRAFWGRLLEAGIEMYEFQPTLYHTKMMIVDDCMVSVGSTNFDNRSFRLNDEANMNIFDTGFAEELVKVFEKDKARSRQTTLEQWQNRPLKERVAERFAGLLRSQL
jgi:cardiolipin synthase A/B